MCCKICVLTPSEENYLKVIYHLNVASPKGVNTNAIALMIETKASSVTDMIKKLAEKELVDYQKYQGVTLTEKGQYAAKIIIRKHRLWECFLVNKLGFSWDEVHDVAEELEHIQSEKLINKLDAFLDFPKEDPHGDPIPNEYGEIQKMEKLLLSEAEIGINYLCVGVKDSSSAFLQFLDKQKIALGSKITILEKESFDNTLHVTIDEKRITLSHKIANNLYIK